MISTSCYHCGDKIIGKTYSVDENQFCCNGCKSVYLLLSSNDLESFYAMDSQPGTKPSVANEYKYAFLEVPEIRNKFVHFEDESSAHITLFLPQIHCSSCIYLLENIHRIEPRVQSCQVNFTKRRASIIFSKELKLSELAHILDKIGYAPNFGDREEQTTKQNYKYLYKLGVAGFAFGSIMLWSFPEYLGIEQDNPEFRNFTSYLSFSVSLPVFFYSANEYLVSAFKAIRFRSLNLDVPISIGIIALYIQSCYSIFSGFGPGYMDSFAGFVFLLLIGKWFQSKTYESLSFERDYTAYFPVATTRVDVDKETIVEIDQVKKGDKILVRNQEVIPCDSILNSKEVKIDYSFVTGESMPVTKIKGDFIYAGGKLIGQKSTFIVQKESNRSHLTQLWNDSSSKTENTEKKQDKLSTYFLIGLIVVALIAGIVWAFIDKTRVTEIVVSILIVACPCALALSAPFTYGNIMRLLGRKGLYLKNADVIEKINSAHDIVFDKTGTLTTGSSNDVNYEGIPLSQADMDAIVILANSSTHPLSKSIVTLLKDDTKNYNAVLEDFVEISGEGIEGKINGRIIKLGSAGFVHNEATREKNETASHLSIDGHYFGKFIFTSEWRSGIWALLRGLNSIATIHILSGDNDTDKAYFEKNIPESKEIHFNQTPKDKFSYIESLNRKGKKVIMIGDGLNDTGAMDIAEVGIAISEDVFRFTPSSDAIIEASKLDQLIQLIQISRFSRTVLFICYSFSIIYNIIGLTFAISGNLTPLIAAILMPLSSISIVLISTLSMLVKK